MSPNISANLKELSTHHLVCRVVPLLQLAVLSEEGLQRWDLMKLLHLDD